MRRLARNLAGDDAGAAIIELALAAPILALMIMGTADIALAYSRKLALEQGAQRAVEKVMQTTQLKQVQTTIADEVAIQAKVDASRVTVTFPKYCDGRLLPDLGRDDDGFAKGECDPDETPAHYIQVVVTDEYKPLFPTLHLGTKLSNGKYRVIAQAGMRTK
ncbi:TadE/TadG family type IV pilus assembly protein [Sphingomonas sp. LHG3406-1]|uniref:TadE/TadG family type IV pilus assembly protein n=1 Tax=Sphingomonas sp. LHG3406-1 TaxID=2804617 RepID=UPI002617B9CF|nr:TadE/TadG family type IV pilus assembly protein [Sphingomonas sp. LHG3406-1]